MSILQPVFFSLSPLVQRPAMGYVRARCPAVEKSALSLIGASKNGKNKWRSELMRPKFYTNYKGLELMNSYSFIIIYSHISNTRDLSLILPINEQLNSFQNFSQNGFLSLNMKE